MKNHVETLSAVLVQAIEAAGFTVAGPTDSRVAERGEPAWVCNARAALADSAAGLLEVEEARRGQLIADMFLLRKDLPNYPDRYKSTTGNKTAIGVYRTMKRLVDDGE